MEIKVMDRIRRMLWLAPTCSMIAICLLLAESVPAAGKPVLNIFLIQNSGWMEPFYTDPGSKFKPFIEEVILRTTPREGEAIIAGFNQSAGNNRSPLLVYRGKNRDEMIASLQGIEPAMKPGGKAFADTDFKEALIGAVTQYSPGTPCILWVFTNNKNSPDNSSETARRNTEFYTWLKDEKNIKRILAYPFSMPVKGRRYEASGIMVYAMAYGAAADDVLKTLTKAGLPFGKQSGRLKPLDTEAVTFVPTGATQNKNVSAVMGEDGKTLVLEFKYSNSPEVAVISGQFINDFYPYDIQSANISLQVRFHGESHNIKATVEPRKLVAVPTGGTTKPIIIRIEIPPLPGIWRHPGIIFKSGYQVSAEMTFTLADQDLRLSPDFEKLMDKLLPGDPLPELFIPGEASRQSATVSPLLVKVAYPVWPLIVLVLVVLVLIFGSIFLLNIMTRPRKYTISVDGIQKVYLLKAFSRHAVHTEEGECIGTLKRGLGKPSVRLEEGRNEQITIM